MEHTNIITDGLAISYKKIGNGEKSVVFIHGNSLNNETYKNQQSNLFLPDFTKIFLDLPGHGNSAFSNNPEKHYNIPFYCEVLKEIIKELNLKQVCLVGHSLGGHIAIQFLAKKHPSVNGILVFGTPPISLPPDFSAAFLPNPKIGLLFKGELTAEEITLLSDEFTNKTVEKELIYRAITSTDPNARMHFTASVAQGKVTDEVEILKTLDIPFALVHAQDDSIINKAYLNTIKSPNLFKETVLEIANSGHTPQLDNPKSFNALVQDFVNKLN